MSVRTWNRNIVDCVKVKNSFQSAIMFITQISFHQEELKDFHKFIMRDKRKVKTVRNGDIFPKLKITSHPEDKMGDGIYQTTCFHGKRPPTLCAAAQQCH